MKNIYDAEGGLESMVMMIMMINSIITVCVGGIGWLVIEIKMDALLYTICID